MFGIDVPWRLALAAGWQLGNLSGYLSAGSWRWQLPAWQPANTAGPSLAKANGGQRPSAAAIMRGRENSATSAPRISAPGRLAAGWRQPAHLTLCLAENRGGGAGSSAAVAGYAAQRNGNNNGVMSIMYVGVRLLSVKWLAVVAGHPVIFKEINGRLAIYQRGYQYSGMAA